MLRMISVATPSSYVSNGGPYFTLKSDGVIKWILGALPANIENTLPVPGWFDHSFIENYIQGAPSGSQIVNAVTDPFNSFEKEDKSEAKECLAWFKALDLKNNSECPMNCMTAIIDMGTFYCHNHCEELCRCSDRN